MFAMVHLIEKRSRRNPFLSLIRHEQEKRGGAYRSSHMGQGKPYAFLEGNFCVAESDKHDLWQASG